MTLLNNTLFYTNKKLSHVFVSFLHFCCLSLLLLTSFISYAANAQADTSSKVKIAVASNFYYTLSELLKSYPQADNVQFKLSSGSSGLLYAQIKQGAPFDLFLSADSLRPNLLEQDGLTLSRHTYALGKLVLWANEKALLTEDRAQLKKRTSYSQVLSSHQGKLAYANPKLAPFGIATQQVLSYLKLDDEYKNRRILGNNVNQVFQFVDSGNVALGFVPESLLLQAQQQLKQKKYQNYWLIPKQQYQVIQQQLVSLKRSKYQTEVKELVDYLLSDNIQQRIQNMGYNSPKQLSDRSL